MTRFKIGFTGTRNGMTDVQKINFMEIFSWCQKKYQRRDLEFHQGQCIGADLDALLLVQSVGGVWTVSHPPLDTSKIHDVMCDEVRLNRPYLVRNRNIVDEVDFMLIAPRSREEELRSGTWATYRYALKTFRPFEMIWPD